jgi:beta-glucosidase
MIDKSMTDQIVFSGSSRKPWRAYVGDSSNWSTVVSGSETLTAFGKLSVKTVDGNVQEDSRALEWTGDRESQFFFQSELPLDLTALDKVGAALSVRFKVDKRPEGRVIQRMDCGYPCSGSLDLTKMLSALPEGKWVTAAIKLSCFAAKGVDLSRVNTPFVLVSKEPFAMTISDVRISAEVPASTLVSCN